MTTANNRILAIAFAYVTLSGLSIWSQKLYWISAVLGGGVAVRVMHPAVALAVVVVFLWASPRWWQALLAVLLLGSGVILWYPEQMPRQARLIAMVAHPLAAFSVIGGIIVHSRWFRKQPP